MLADMCRICRQHKAVPQHRAYNPAHMCAQCRRALRKKQRVNPFGQMQCWPQHYAAGKSCVKRLCIAKYIGVVLTVDPLEDRDVIERDPEVTERLKYDVSM